MNLNGGLPDERRLMEELAAAPRGPRRNGWFALWLVLRVSSDRSGAEVVSPRAHERRCDALERRLRTVSLPAPLRRSLPTVLLHLRANDPTDSVEALRAWRQPVRESLGTAAVAFLDAAMTRHDPTGGTPRDGGLRIS